VGLDAVELVMRTEDEFSITLTDDEAGTVRTVDDLYQLVISKLDVTPSCLSSKAFYRTRQALGAFLAALTVLACTTLVSHAFPGVISGLALWIPAFVTWIILFALINSVFQRYATRLQTELPCETAGDLSRLVLTSNFEHFSPTAAQSTAISKEYVWKKLVDIICDQLQVGREEVVPRATFAEDLGVD